MIRTILERELISKDAARNAGGKAREDLHKIFLKQGIVELVLECPVFQRDSISAFKKIIDHIQIGRAWDKALNKLQAGDVLIMQFPVVNHTLLLNNSVKKAKKRRIKIWAFIHDLEVLRQSKDKKYSRTSRWRMKKEELDELKQFDKIVAHNEHMKEYLVNVLGLDEKKIVILGIFDYLMDEDFKPSDKTLDMNSCIIAGNLARNKSAYIYDLPGTPDFELYGVNYENMSMKNVHYKGSFLPNELPYYLHGGFGLVWDGDSIETCNGAWGEYLRYNNPHKTSLYLACGIPVIIWEEAALADFIKSKDVGITVGSLYDIPEAVEGMTKERYLELRRNATELSKKIRKGHFTINALKQCGII